MVRKLKMKSKAPYFIFLELVSLWAISAEMAFAAPPVTDQFVEYQGNRKKIADIQLQTRNRTDELSLKLKIVYGNGSNVPSNQEIILTRAYPEKTAFFLKELLETSKSLLMKVHEASGAVEIYDLNSGLREPIEEELLISAYQVALNKRSEYPVLKAHVTLRYGRWGNEYTGPIVDVRIKRTRNPLRGTELLLYRGEDAVYHFNGAWYEPIIIRLKNEQQARLLLSYLNSAHSKLEIQARFSGSSTSTIIPEGKEFYKQGPYRRRISGVYEKISIFDTETGQKEKLSDLLRRLEKGKHAARESAPSAALASRNPEAKTKIMLQIESSFKAKTSEIDVPGEGSSPPLPQVVDSGPSHSYSDLPPSYSEAGDISALVDELNRLPVYRGPLPFTNQEDDHTDELSADAAPKREFSEGRAADLN